MQTNVRRRAAALRAERGAVAVEFALILPILVMLLVGTVTGGVAFSRSIGVTNAVREGARFGATADIASGTWAQDVIDRTRETQFDDGATAATSHTTVCVQVEGATPVPQTCSTAGIDAPPAPSFSGSAPSEPGVCVVKVWAARNYTITLGVWDPLSGDINKQAAARYERVC